MSMNDLSRLLQQRNQEIRKFESDLARLMAENERYRLALKNLNDQVEEFSVQLLTKRGMMITPSLAEASNAADAALSGAKP